MTGVLDGIRVLDFSRFIAGPSGAALLGDLGAEVIRIDSPKGEDDRGVGPSGANGERIWFPHWNHGKKGITLSLRTEEGRALALDLVRCSDVVVHNFVPQTRQNAFLQYENLKTVNPCIIVAAVSAFGQDGPWGNRSGFDGLAQAMSGVTTLTGQADGPPQKTGIPWSDFWTGANLVSGTALALLHRSRTGLGQMIDLSLLDLAVYPVIAAGYVSEVRHLNVVRRRLGNQSWYTYVNTFQAKDGRYVVVSPGTDGQFFKMVIAMGREDLAKDPRNATAEGRFANLDAINAVVGAWIAVRTVDEVVDTLTAAHVPSGPVLNVAEMAEHPQVKARGMLVDVGRPDNITVTGSGFPFKMSATPASVQGSWPYLGEHNPAIYGELLGLSAAAIEQLRSQETV